jgi:hypothetical protein
VLRTLRRQADAGESSLIFGSANFLVDADQACQGDEADRGGDRLVSTDDPVARVVGQVCAVTLAGLGLIVAAALVWRVVRWSLFG